MKYVLTNMTFSEYFTDCGGVLRLQEAFFNISNTVTLNDLDVLQAVGMTQQKFWWVILKWSTYLQIGLFGPFSDLKHHFWSNNLFQSCSACSLLYMLKFSCPNSKKKTRLTFWKSFTIYTVFTCGNKNRMYQIYILTPAISKISALIPFNIKKLRSSRALPRPSARDARSRNCTLPQMSEAITFYWFMEGCCTMVIIGAPLIGLHNLT